MISKRIADTHTNQKPLFSKPIVFDFKARRFFFKARRVFFKGGGLFFKGGGLFFRQTQSISASVFGGSSFSYQFPFTVR
ncbi:hypothetical protein [Bacteroides pyogenes]|uniref:hypothetical protein n=1 Tax=Bacteroides pyogenes TaxID=310300 RepID=UPI001BA6F023|nr:hypothetical protein [Bacteroides pyogenes]